VHHSGVAVFKVLFFVQNSVAECKIDFKFFVTLICVTRVNVE